MKADAERITHELPVLKLKDQAAWERWLEKNHAHSHGAWLKISKKGAGIKTVSYDEAVESALCYGWIDSQANKFDESVYIQKFSPRKPKSIWSVGNRKRVEALIRSGRMKPAGMLAAERAKADGRWDAAYEGQAHATVPPDLRAELDKHPKAKAFFDTLNSVNRYAIIFRVHNAKKAETRAARIEKFIGMLEREEKIHP